MRETEHDLPCRNTEDSGNFIAQNIGVFQTEADMIDCQQAAQEIAQPPDSGLQGKRTVCALGEVIGTVKTDKLCWISG